MIDSRVSESPPTRVMCQGTHGGCAACCGIFNHKDRKDDQRWVSQLKAQTQTVTLADFDPQKLQHIKENFEKENPANELYSSVKVCPFAGFISDERLGCLIHPTRHPQGHDLRHLSVHSQPICAGHFCASHDWLRPIEMELINTAHGVFYGSLVSQPGLVKQLRGCIEAQLGRSIITKDFQFAPLAFKEFWESISLWPYQDPNPKRFGGFVFIGQEATAQTLCHVKKWFKEHLHGVWTNALQELESDFSSETQAQEALRLLRQYVKQLTAQLTN
jgi:hypothetical protein